MCMVGDPGSISGLSSASLPGDHSTSGRTSGGRRRLRSIQDGLRPRRTNRASCLPRTAALSDSPKGLAPSHLRGQLGNATPQLRQSSPIGLSDELGDSSERFGRQRPPAGRAACLAVVMAYQRNSQAMKAGRRSGGTSAAIHADRLLIGDRHALPDDAVRGGCLPCPSAHRDGT